MATVVLSGFGRVSNRRSGIDFYDSNPRSDLVSYSYTSNSKSRCISNSTDEWNGDACLCFPFPADVFKLHPEKYVKAGKIESHFELPGNPDLFPNPERLTFDIKDGAKLDVASFFSSYRKQNTFVDCKGRVFGIDAIAGKQLLILAVHLPVHTRSSEADYIRSIIQTHHELAESHHRFEIVIVASGCCKFESAFNHFFSAFPCLAIPFSDVQTREFICSLLKFHDWTTCAVLVDPIGKVLSYDLPIRQFFLFGSELFPFHEGKVLGGRGAQDLVLQSRLDPVLAVYSKHVCGVGDDPHFHEPLSLHRDILMCDPDYKLLRFNSRRGLTVSELGKKLVGLYICFDGFYMKRISGLYQLCIQNNKEIEIVVVCHPSVGGRSHMDIRSALRRFYTRSWFLYQADNKVYRRVWRVFGQERCSDTFVIIPPDCKSGELEGLGVVTRYGVKGYPFTRSTIAEARCKSLRSLNPISLFNGVDEDHTCLYYLKGAHPEIPVSKSELEGKKLLIYLDGAEYEGRGKLCSLLIQNYSNLKAEGWEVVFIPRYDGIRSDKYFEMPWLMMSHSDVVKACLVDKLDFGDWECEIHLFVVGEDGKFLATQAQERLIENWDTESLLNDFLFEDIAGQLFSIQDPNRFLSDSDDEDDDDDFDWSSLG